MSGEPNPASILERREIRVAGLVLAALLGLRIAAIALDPNQLYADETQYWIWSRSLDWGYFSKPPMIAWIIAATTAVFGNADWAVRLAAPFLHTITAVFLGLTAHRLFDARTGMWTAIGWVTLPAVWLSATVITTDAVLMTGWSAGLYCLVRLRDRPGWISAIGLGLAGGFGFLSKYAMIYFLLGTVLAILVDRPSRRALVSLKGLVAGLITLALVLPNLLWNAEHDFATVSHTAANANWSGNLLNPGELSQFLLDQLGVFGPAFFPILVVAAVQAFRVEALASPMRRRVMLALYAAPALAIVCVQAFISRAHANWAASAYAAGLILTIAFLREGPPWRRRVLYASIGLHSLAGLALMALAASMPLSEAFGMANAFKRVRGWDVTAERLTEAWQQSDTDALVFDNRNDFHQMQRYAPGIDAPLYMWLRHAGPISHAEQAWPLPESYAGTVMVVSERPQEIPVLRRDFETFERYGEITVPIGGGRVRHYDLFLAQGHRREARTPAYEEAIRRNRRSGRTADRDAPG